MKRDALIAIGGIAVIGALTYGLAAIRPPFIPRKSAPFGSTAVGPTATTHVVMRVNGEAITQEEYQAAFDALPDDLKRQFGSIPGKQAFAEQLIRMKLLEQEGRRLGLDQDPKVVGRIAAERTNILAMATADKLVGTPTDEAIQTFYNKNQQRFRTIDVSHILISFQGGVVPPRDGGTPPSQVEATNRALQVYQQLRGGADFATLAKRFSDDPASADHGGKLGTFSKGMLPQEFEARVFQLDPGQISEPIPSRFGIHIFRVTRRGTAPLRQVSGGISRHVRQQNTFDRVELLRKNAKVDFDAKFFPDAKNWPGSAPPAGKRPS